jgi:hypothetical protein
MDCLATNPKSVGDRLPTPTLRTRTANVDRFQPLLQPLQRKHRTQTHLRVLTGRRVIERIEISHTVKVD